MSTSAYKIHVPTMLSVLTPSGVSCAPVTQAAMATHSMPAVTVQWIKCHPVPQYAVEQMPSAELLSTTSPNVTARQINLWVTPILNVSTLFIIIICNNWDGFN